jgi:hypothetical protein
MLIVPTIYRHLSREHWSLVREEEEDPDQKQITCADMLYARWVINQR